MSRDLSEALQHELTLWLGPAAGIDGVPRRLGGGKSAESYRFALRDAPAGTPMALVLRLDRDDGLAARMHAIQRVVAAAGIAAPPLLRTGDSASGFGQPFAIMPLMQGRDPLADGAVRHIPQILAATAAALHAIDPEPVRTALHAAGLDVRRCNLGGVLAELVTSPRRDIADAARRLADRFPARPLVVCHGDLHGYNLLLEAGQVTAVLDWELALLAPREYDIARTELALSLMPGVGFPGIRRLVRAFGARAARQFLAAYRAQAPLDASMLESCRALHVLRLLALARSGEMPATEVRRLWIALEPVLAQRWRALTGRAI